jgi:hypothetical protein
LTNKRNLTLAIFVASTFIFASLTIIEYVQIDLISSELKVAQQTTTTSTCENTGGIGCPHLLNNSYSVSVDYAGPWGISYQGYLLDTGSSNESMVESGSFYGHGPANQSIIVTGVSETGTAICAQAHKLDASNLTLTLRIASATNETSMAYGAAKICIENLVV